MPFYNVVVHGPCEPVQTPTGSEPRGFYVPCFVRADNPDSAVAKALEDVRQSPKSAQIAAAFDSPVPILETTVLLGFRGSGISAPSLAGSFTMSRSLRQPMRVLSNKRLKLAARVD